MSVTQPLHTTRKAAQTHLAINNVTFSGETPFSSLSGGDRLTRM